MSIAWTPLAPGVWRATYLTPTSITASAYAFHLDDGTLNFWSGLNRFAQKKKAKGN